MFQSALAALSLMMLFVPGTAGVSAPKASDLNGVEIAQVRIQQYIVIRVPSVPANRVNLPPKPIPPVEWEEKSADKCIPANELAPIAFTRPDSVDLTLIGGKRLRAKLDEECAALDFYSGFYIKPQKDGKICAARDSIRSRSGAACRIKAFRQLVPAE